MKGRFKYGNVLLVASIFTVFISTLIYIGNMARNRFDLIIETLVDERIETTPEQDARTVQSLLAEIELAVKIFTLTSEDEALMKFYDLSFEMTDQFEQMDEKSAHYPPEIAQAVDSLKEVTFRRIRIFEDFVETRDEFRVQKAMSKVESEFEKATSKISAKYAESRTSRGKERSLRQLFTSDKQKETYDSRQERVPDAIVQEFGRNLRELSKEESQRESELRAKSLEVISSEDQVRQQVDSIVNVIAEIRLKKNLAQQQRIEELAAASSKSVTYTAVAAIAFIIVFAYLVAMQIRSANRYMKASKEASERALELARSKENFITNVSHELRTPLNAIIGFSELSEKERDAAKKGEYNRIVKESGQHLKSLINDLLDLSKIESGLFTFEKTAFDPQVILSEVREIVYSQYNSAKVRFALRSNIKNTHLAGDPVRLKQVLINILNNAFKFTDEGEVRLVMEEESIGENKTLLRVKVSDTGIGISREHLARIFDDFEQVNSERNSKYEGSGLGLSITKRIIEQQGGNIEVQSTPNKGSVFTFEIPYETNLATVGKSNPRDTRIGANNLTVLIADDSEFNRKLLVSLLEGQQTTVWQASSGAEALKIYLDVRPVLCLFDIKMPGMDGIELARRVREAAGSTLPLMVALTAASSAEILTACESVGYKAVLPKPFEHADLFAIINDHFGHHPSEEPTAIAPKSKPLELDTARVQQIFAGDNAFRNEMLGVFIESMTREISGLAEAVKTGDTTTVDDLCHKSLPSCRQIGAEALVETLETMRTHARNNEGREVLRHDFTQLKQQFRSVRKIIEGIIA